MILIDEASADGRLRVLLRRRVLQDQPFQIGRERAVQDEIGGVLRGLGGLAVDATHQDSGLENAGEVNALLRHLRGELTGGAKRRLQKITPAGYEARIDLTITDEGPMAHAFVIISAVADGGG